ncbi:MAG TPA: B-box zinc finger protein [Candidatus Saccharimonadales bacterium]|nr:B-box zinc finger protein [Candidatus Saccharimonadales bacterium]
MSEEFSERESSPETCNNCAAIFDPAYGYCPHCGAVMPELGETCAEHPRREAIARCVACETPICEECAQESEGRYVCESDLGALDTSPWVSVFTSAEEWEVEARRQLLDQSHIPAVRFAPGTLTSAPSGEHDLLVPPTREDEAREVLESADISLVDGETDWEKGKGGEERGPER